MTRFTMGWLFNSLSLFRTYHIIRYLSRKKITILVYHGFTDKARRGSVCNNQGLHIDVQKFRLQLEYIKKYYNVLPLNRLIEDIGTGSPIPDNPLVITIDDGYRSTYTIAYPILRQYAIPAAIFLSTDFIDKREFLWIDRIEYAIDRTETKGFNLKIENETEYFDLFNPEAKSVSYGKIYPRLIPMHKSQREAIIDRLEKELGVKLSEKNSPDIYLPLAWEEINEMAKSGIISAGSHGLSHISLAHHTPGEIRNELGLSKQILESRLGARCRLFSYPFGGINNFDSITEGLLRETGYSCGLTTLEGMNDKDADVYTLKRVGVDGRGDLILFIASISGIVKFLSNINGALVRGFHHHHKGMVPTYKDL